MEDFQTFYELYLLYVKKCISLLSFGAFWWTDKKELTSAEVLHDVYVFYSVISGIGHRSSNVFFNAKPLLQCGISNLTTKKTNKNTTTMKDQIVSDDSSIKKSNKLIRNQRRKSPRWLKSDEIWVLNQIDYDEISILTPLKCKRKCLHRIVHRFLFLCNRKEAGAKWRWGKLTISK